MARAEFEEKEFEVALAGEFRGRGSGWPVLFSSGQVLEHVLAYDAAGDAGQDHVIWRLLDVPRPRGLRLLPAMWEPGARPPLDRLPRSTVSLILQYKRPEFMYGPTAAQWRLWHHPYFRFHRSPRQHRVLRRLERNLQEGAVVRYVAPAFWRRGELERAQLQGTVLDRSGFVAPETIGGHRVWTYTDPGRVGRPNPWGEPVRFQTVDDLFSPIVDTQVENRGLVLARGWLESHLSLLADAAVDREPGLRRDADVWTENVLYADLGLSKEQVSAVRNLSIITTLTTQIGATWHVVGPPGDELG